VPRSVPAGLLILAAVSLIAACGLESVPVLDPPGFTDLTPTNQNSVLTNVPTVVDEFRGYELYYKFYLPGQDKQTSMTSVDQLIPAGFRRVCSDQSPVDSQIPPVILVDQLDRNTSVMTTLVFQDADIAAFALYAGAAPRTVTLRRAVEENGEPEYFRISAFDADDEDLASIWSEVEAQGNELHLALYVMSNGLNGFSPTLYSEIRYIGYMVYHL
jgi:hypothetical protein